MEEVSTNLSTGRRNGSVILNFLRDSLALSDVKEVPPDSSTGKRNGSVILIPLCDSMISGLGLTSS